MTPGSISDRVDCRLLVGRIETVNCWVQYKMGEDART